MTIDSTMGRQGLHLRRAWRLVLNWAGQVRLGAKLTVALTVAAVAAGIATWAALTETQPFGQDARTLFILLNVDLIILLALAALIARRLVQIWAQRRHNQAGSRLHIRLVAWFSVIAIAPTIMVVGFSLLFFYLGVQTWFSDRVRTALDESLSVAQAYLVEHQQVLRGDALAMAVDLDRQEQRLRRDATAFDQFMSEQAYVRGLDEALVIDSGGGILGRSQFALSLQFEPIDFSRFANAVPGQVFLLDRDDAGRSRAVVKLNGYGDGYLIVGRSVEQRVTAHVDRVKGAVAQYQTLNQTIGSLQISFVLIFGVVALLLLLVTVWVGMLVANALVAPISRLIDTAERVRAGDLSARVPEQPTPDELGVLSRAFNRMTSQLERQRADLVEANHQLDHRSRFTETVLAGVSAGVLGLDEQGRVNLPNTSALTLLDLSYDEVIDRPVTEVIPELQGMVERIWRRPTRLIEEQVQIRRGGTVLTLLVRIAGERLDGRIRGFVVTFDDITELLGAQRKAAWADVARRIAHEIKNPLTPIQLSAERLRRRYLKQVSEDPETFRTCIDTIIRQVEAIGGMVDEFSAFARMPQPSMKPVNLRSLCEEAVFLQRNAHPELAYRLDVEGDPEVLRAVRCDSRQISQAVTNLLQNAADALTGSGRTNGGPTDPTVGSGAGSGTGSGTGSGAGSGAGSDDGREGHGDESAAASHGIRLALQVEADTVAIVIEDTGPGLPADDRDRLTEPYVTTRAKGTGLGLAIVKKIMEDHGGGLSLGDRTGGGARVVLSLPITGDA